MENFFKSFLRKNFPKVTKEQRKKAEVSAKTYTAKKLKKYCHTAATSLDAETRLNAEARLDAETRLVGASDREERLAAAKKELEKYEIALDAKRAWNRVGPYKKQYSFRPSETGDNLDKLPQLLELGKMNDSVRGRLSLKEVRKVYWPWKEKYDELIRRHEEAPEKEQQIKFFHFLDSLNIEIGDVRKFYKLGTYKGDILLEPVGKEDFSFVEIKAIYKIDENIQEVLKEALYQAAMHVVLACIMHPMPIENTVEPPQAKPPKKRSKSPENASQAPPPKKKS
ncbi:MAG: uncharacterized protein A8A55_2630, partial [Amphiamblys sp. WSBS2006]